MLKKNNKYGKHGKLHACPDNVAHACWPAWARCSSRMARCCEWSNCGRWWSPGTDCSDVPPRTRWAGSCCPWTDCCTRNPWERWRSRESRRGCTVHLGCVAPNCSVKVSELLWRIIDIMSQITVTSINDFRLQGHWNYNLTIFYYYRYIL